MVSNPDILEEVFGGFPTPNSVSSETRTEGTTDFTRKASSFSPPSGIFSILIAVPAPAASKFYRTLTYTFLWVNTEHISEGATLS
jgi:hypothetical protein